jgi:hypothetical protein
MRKHPPVREPVFRDGVWVIPPPRPIEEIERLLREDPRALTTDDWMALLRGEEDGSRFIGPDYAPNS